MRKATLFFLPLSFLATACALDPAQMEETSSDVAELAVPLPKLQVSSNPR